MAAVPFVVVPQFPTVPNVSGVPVLARAAQTAQLALSVTSAIQRVLLSNSAPASVLFQATKAAPIWGVFDSNGNRVIDADSMLAFDYRAEWAVSDYPIQQGEFSSYDKVTRPFDTSVVLTKGGSQGDRTNFLQQCETVASSLNLYQIFTPEKTYSDVNVTRIEMSRKETKGAFFVVVELFFRRINQTTPQYSTAGMGVTDTSNASVPTAIPVANNGLVQALTPTPQTVTAVNNKVLQPTAATVGN